MPSPANFASRSYVSARSAATVAARGLCRFPECGTDPGSGSAAFGDEFVHKGSPLSGARFELGTAADVSVWFIAAFEDGKATPDFLVCYEVELDTAQRLDCALVTPRSSSFGVAACDFKSGFLLPARRRAPRVLHLGEQLPGPPLRRPKVCPSCIAWPEGIRSMGMPSSSGKAR